MLLSSKGAVHSRCPGGRGGETHLGGTFLTKGSVPSAPWADKSAVWFRERFWNEQSWQHSLSAEIISDSLLF